MKKEKHCFGKRTKGPGYLPFCLAFCLVLPAVLGGCGSRQEIPVENIELQEPLAATAAAATEKVRRRNLYDAALYESYVTPYTEEYSFDAARQFGAYAALPGDTVKKGDLLVSAVQTDLLERIDALQETLQGLSDDFEKYRLETEESLREQREDLDYLESILKNLEKQKPEEQIPGQNGTLTVNPALAPWQAEYDKWKGDYNLQEFYITKAERELRQQKELYDLDCQYYNGQLRKLREEQKGRIITSEMDGTIVGIRSLTSGNKLTAGDPVIAVGDLSRKRLLCESIPLRVRKNAADIYAFINGKRYEVTELETDDMVHTVYELHDENDEIPMGAYAVLVIMRDYRRQVLTVPADAVVRNNGKDYVYVVEDGRTVPKEVQKGMTDNVFVEILSGLAEGEDIVVSWPMNPFEVPVTLEKGSAGSPSETKGQIYLPKKISITNPIEYGTTFMNKFMVEANQKVKKGDVIALVTVEGDELEISRLETRLQRDRERLADLVAKNREEDEKTILQMQESIREQEEVLESRKRCYNTTEILSPINGYIEGLSAFTNGEIIDPGDFIASIQDEKVLYVGLSTINDNTPAFGVTMEMTYFNHDYDSETARCRAVTLLPDYLSPPFQQFVLLQPDDEVLENIEVTDEELDRYTSINKTLVTLTGIKKAVDNVVILPEKALQDEAKGKNIGYVWVKGEDGSPFLTPVLLNPHNSQRRREYYWVIDGLTEGMEVLCLE